MSSVLLLAVNRHQERYFRKIAAASTQTLRFTVLHDSRLPYFFLSFLIPSKQRRVLEDVVKLKVATDAQEVRGYQLSTPHRLFLTVKYRFSVYLFFLRAREFFRRHPFEMVGLWSGMKWRQRIVRLLLLTPQTKTVFFENGAFPDTTTVDPKGVNFGSSLPDDPEFYRSCIQEQGVELPTSLDIRKGKKKKEAASDQPLPERYIFVPFQVDSDTQIVEYSPWIRNMEQLHNLLADVSDNVGAACPVFVVKEHPSSKNDYRHLHRRHPGIQFYNQVNTQELIERADCVMTINSSVGFEALLLNKPVITLGQAFYALPGLVNTAKTVQEAAVVCLNYVQPDQELRSTFLNYLYSSYFIHGNWRNPGQEHLERVCQRIKHLVESA